MDNLSRDSSTCSVDHDALKTDAARWALLDFVGTMPTYDDTPGAAQSLELRNCPTCHSTIARELAAPFTPPPSPLDMVPAIRWAFSEAGRGAQLVDVLHHVERDGRQVAAVSLVAAERNGRHWEIEVIEGPALDFGSEDLLAADLNREHRGAPCFCQIDPLDMAIERCRMSLERKLAQEAA